MIETMDSTKGVIPQIIHIFQNIFFCVQRKEGNSYRFGTTWGWKKYDSL